MNGNIADYIIYKNNQLIAFNKPCGLAIQSSTEDHKSLHQLAEIYCKHSLGIIHRIDQPTSGVCIFSKTKKALVHLNQQMQSRSIKKMYWGIIPKGEIKEEDTLIHFIKRNGKIKKAFISTKEGKGYKKAELHYKIISHIDNYSLVEIELITGRFHQIRAQFAELGFPIKGDVKYGSRRGNKDRGIALHAKSLSFTHPVTQEKILLEAEPPKDDIWSAFQL